MSNSESAQLLRRTSDLTAHVGDGNRLGQLEAAVLERGDTSKRELGLELVRGREHGRRDDLNLETFVLGRNERDARAGVVLRGL